MTTMSAKEAKNRFGRLLMEAQKEPVIIEKNGRPVAAVVSMESHELAEELKLEALRQAIQERRDAHARGDLLEVTDPRAYAERVKRRAQETEALRHEALKTAIQEGIDELDAGRGIEVTDLKAFFDGIRQEARERAAKFRDGVREAG